MEATLTVPTDNSNAFSGCGSVNVCVQAQLYNYWESKNTTVSVNVWSQTTCLKGRCADVDAHPTNRIFGILGRDGKHLLSGRR